ncbi:MAG: A/G-specific adenine glycosylase [Planctomycetes bacterium]|nr:A/G-specific adenine glycosylase [Planctomycetota bacterium]
MTSVPPKLDVPVVRRRVLAWYRAHRRDLPWRRLSVDPYATLVVEMMAQQTQITTVLPYYRRFLKRFPTVRSLARADIDDVLPYWAGLGYYRRCHHLHAAARMIVEDFGGRWPRDVETLQTLPGVGRYTAGAVASIAFGVPTPAVDGNVKRVLVRLLGLDGWPDSPGATERIWAAAGELVAPRRPGEFNQGLMGIGSRVCRPHRPDCGVCPLRACCRFAIHGGPDPLRRNSKRTTVTATTLVTVALQRHGQLFYRRRPNTGLWAGLWEWPTDAPNDSERPHRVAERLVSGVSSGHQGRVQRFHTMTHQLSHRRITFHAYRVVVDGVTMRAADGRWLREGREQALPLSSAQVRLLEALRNADRLTPGR